MGCSHHLAPIAESNSPCCCGLPGLHFGLIGGMHSIPMIVVYIAKLPTKAQCHWRSLPALQQCMVASNGCRQSGICSSSQTRHSCRGIDRKVIIWGENHFIFVQLQAQVGTNHSQARPSPSIAAACVILPTLFSFIPFCQGHITGCLVPAPTIPFPSQESFFSWEKSTEHWRAISSGSETHLKTDQRLSGHRWQNMDKFHVN